MHPLSLSSRLPILLFRFSLNCATHSRLHLPLLMLHALNSLGHNALIDSRAWSIAQQMLSVQIALHIRLKERKRERDFN